MRIGVLFYFNLFLSIVIAFFSNEVLLAFEYVFLFGLGNFVVKGIFKQKKTIDNLQVFNFVFFLLSIFLLITHFSLIRNPYIDYFFHNDQIVFYECAIDVGGLNWNNLIEGSLLNPQYSNYPLVSLLYGLFAKFAINIGIQDVYLFLKMIIVLMSSLIPTIICTTLYEIGYRKSCSNEVVYFSILSFLFVTSNVLTRDIFVALNYTLFGYLILKPICNFRYFKLAILVIITFGFRPENGAFSILFIVVRLIVVEMKNFNFFKLVLVFFLLVLFSSIAYFLIENFQLLDKSLDQNQYLDEALKEGSMFGSLKGLPIPFNFIAVFLYVQLMPFPLSIFIEWDYSGWYTVTSILTPFYWIYIWLIILFSMFKQENKLSLLNAVFYLSFFYIIIVDFLEPSVRRGFAAYPIVFIFYMMNKDKFSSYFKKNIFIASFVFISVLNIFAYLMLNL